MKLDVRLIKIKSCIVLKDAIAEKFVANGHYSFTFVFTFSVVVVDLTTDCILSFLFPAETDVLVPVFSHSTDVVVVNFVVVLKFPNNDQRPTTTPLSVGIENCSLKYFSDTKFVYRKIVERLVFCVD